MVADTLEELHAMAAGIGMKRAWFQPRSFPHYDVSQERRRIALGLGAVEIDRRALARFMRSQKEKTTMPQDRVDSASDDRTANNGVRHAYRVLSEAEKAAMVAVKDCGADFLKKIDQLCPSGRESAIARTKVEEAVMWAVKGLTG